MKDLKANEIYRTSTKIPFGVRNGSLYIYNGVYWVRIEDREATVKICSLYSETDQPYLSDSAMKDTLGRIKNTPGLQLVFVDENYQRYINLNNGVFDVETSTLIDRNPELKFSYVANFEYMKGVTMEDTPEFKKFVESVFTEETEEKTKLLLEILGYSISDYQTAKAGFFFIGASNSGKSTLLEVLKKILPEKSVTAVPLHRLTNRFNIARLDGARMNICSEINEKSFAALDLFKQMTSNEVVTAEHKCQAPFEFRLKCKSLNAGNMLPQINALEGMDAVLNRMVILYFPVSIDKAKQDKQLVEKLYQERNYIFSMAIDALIRLKENNFIFTEPTDTKTLKEHLISESKVFENFIEDCCIEGKGKEIPISRLYEAFSLYCEGNLVEAKYTKRQFSQKIFKKPKIGRVKKRLNTVNPVWVAVGITLKPETE